jgi:serpin B
VSNAFHQAFMRVDERGTEAAAATAVPMVLSTGPALRMDPPKVFRADHPFLLLLRDSHTGAWLLMGRVVSP